MSLRSCSYCYRTVYSIYRCALLSRTLYLLRTTCCAYSLRSYLLVHYVHYVLAHYVRSAFIALLALRCAHRSLRYSTPLCRYAPSLRIFTTFIFARSLFAALIVHCVHRSLTTRCARVHSLSSLCSLVLRYASYSLASLLIAALVPSSLVMSLRS
jgi:hypothetical protein